jgi:major membrane immunogen (membrane-anchored lipoprotein)
MNRARDILYINYEYKNKTSYVKPEDFEDYYTNLKKMETALSYHIFVPKNDSNLSKLNNALDIEKINTSAISVVYWIIGLIIIIGIGLIIFTLIKYKK